MFLVSLKKSGSSQPLALADMEQPGLGQVPPLHVYIWPLPCPWPEQQEALSNPTWHPLSSSTCMATGSPRVASAGNSSCFPGNMFLLLSLLRWHPPSLYFFPSKPKPIPNHLISGETLHGFSRWILWVFAAENAPSSVFPPSSQRARFDKVILNNVGTGSYQQGEHQQFRYNTIKNTSLFSHW